jgi:hypothetical protein
MKRVKLNPRKLLVASIGVATIDYLGLSGCSGRAADDPIAAVANLMPPPYVVNVGGNSGVANLVAPPPSVANLMPPPAPPLMPPRSDPDPARDAGTDAAPADRGEARDAALDAG